MSEGFATKSADAGKNSRNQHQPTEVPEIERI
jgi:hypothetical protein